MLQPYTPLATFAATSPATPTSSYVDAAVAPGDATVYTPENGFVFSTRMDVIGINIPPSIKFLRLAGYHSIGDNGGGLFARTPVIVLPVMPWQFQTLDGSWWTYCEDTITPEVCGAIGDGAAFDAVPLQAAINYAQLVGNATEGAAGAVIGRNGSRYYLETTVASVVPIQIKLPYLLYGPVSGGAIVLGDIKTYRNWGYHVQIGTIRAANGNLATPITSINGAGNDGLVCRCLQYSYVEVNFVIAFTRFNVFMDSTNTAPNFTRTVSGACSINNAALAATQIALAVAGGMSLSDATAAHGSTVFTLIGANFTAMHAGDDITIPGAGIAGAPLVTMIAAVINATQVVLVNPAITSVATTATITWSGGQQNQQNYYKFGQLGDGGYGYFEDSCSAATGAFNDNEVHIGDCAGNLIHFVLNNGNDNDNKYTMSLEAPSIPSSVSASIDGSYNNFTVDYLDGPWIWQGGAVENTVTFGNDVNTGVVIGYGGVLNKVKCNGNYYLPTTVTPTADGTYAMNAYGVNVTLLASFEVVPGTSGTSNISIELDVCDSRGYYPVVGSGAYPPVQYMTTASVSPVITFQTISIVVPAGWSWKITIIQGTGPTGSTPGRINLLSTWIMELP